MSNVIGKKPVKVGRKGRDFESENFQLFDLKRMKDGFLMEQKCRGNSEKTITYYHWNITHFIEYLEAQGLPIDTSVIAKDEIKKYIVYLKEVKRWEGLEFVNPEGHLASKSVQTYIRALKGWISWMEDEGYLSHIVSKEIKLPKATAPLVEILSEEEIQKILKLLDEKKNNHLRDMVIVTVLIECGLRLEEVTKLKIANVRLNQNTLKILGKGNKERLVSYGTYLQKLFFKYINQERPEPASSKIDSLFLKEDGTPISQTTVKQLFRRLCNKTGITKLHPHLCRHTYCTLYLAHGGDIFSLRQSTGHESFEVLNNYVHLAGTIVNIKDKNLSLIDSMKLKI